MEYSADDYLSGVGGGVSVWLDHPAHAQRAHQHTDPFRSIYCLGGLDRIELELLSAPTVAIAAPGGNPVEPEQHQGTDIKLIVLATLNVRAESLLELVEQLLQAHLLHLAIPVDLPRLTYYRRPNTLGVTVLPHCLRSEL